MQLLKKLSTIVESGLIPKLVESKLMGKRRKHHTAQNCPGLKAPTLIRELSDKDFDRRRGLAFGMGGGQEQCRISCKEKKNVPCAASAAVSKEDKRHTLASEIGAQLSYHGAHRAYRQSCANVDYSQ